MYYEALRLASWDELAFAAQCQPNKPMNYSTITENSFSSSLLPQRPISAQQSGSSLSDVNGVISAIICTALMVLTQRLRSAVFDPDTSGTANTQNPHAGEMPDDCVFAQISRHSAQQMPLPANLAKMAQCLETNHLMQQTQQTGQTRILHAPPNHAVAQNPHVTRLTRHMNRRLARCGVTCVNRVTRKSSKNPSAAFHLPGHSADVYDIVPLCARGLTGYRANEQMTRPSFSGYLHRQRVRPDTDIENACYPR